jgi:hypothetical protein
VANDNPPHEAIEVFNGHESIQFNIFKGHV